MLRSHNAEIIRNLVSIKQINITNDSKISILEENIHLFHTLEIENCDKDRDEKDVYLFFWDEHDQTKIRVLAIEQNKGDTFMSWLGDKFATSLIKKEIMKFKENK